MELSRGSSLVWPLIWTVVISCMQNMDVEGMLCNSLSWKPVCILRLVKSGEIPDVDDY